MAKKSHAVAVLEARIHVLEAEERIAASNHASIEAMLIELQNTLGQIRERKPTAPARKPRKTTRHNNNTPPLPTAAEVVEELSKIRPL